MEWLLPPYKLESDEAQIRQQKTCAHAVESGREGTVSSQIRERDGPWVLARAAMTHIWRNSQCSRS
jgi:hypothetical protein